MHEERGREGEPGAESRERSGNGGPGDERASGGRRGFSDGIRHVNSVLSAHPPARHMPPPAPHAALTGSPRVHGRPFWLPPAHNPWDEQRTDIA